MRSGYKTLMLGIGSLVLAAAMVAPSYAAKSVITDTEMDTVTAAGQPVVISTDEGAIDFRPQVDIALGIEDNAQHDLRALILNNTAGENQLANDMNIASGAGSGRQDNNITQSWGSTYDIDVVKGASATATASASAKGGSATCNAAALICVPKGGNGATATAAQTSTQPSLRRSIYADVILLSDSGEIDYRPQTSIAMDVQNTAQQGLSALVVNNVSGLNQVATGVNLAGNAGTGPVGTTPPTAGGGGNVTVTGAGSAAGQGNIINQFRGTPFSRPQ